MNEKVYTKSLEKFLKIALDNIEIKPQYRTEGIGLSASITASYCEKVS
jgi:hypothetical protein